LLNEIGILCCSSFFGSPKKKDAFGPSLLFYLVGCGTPSTTRVRRKSSVIVNGRKNVVATHEKIRNAEDITSRPVNNN